MYISVHRFVSIDDYVLKIDQKIRTFLRISTR